MKNNIIAIIVGFLLATAYSEGQTFGIYGAANTNIIRESSEYTIATEKLSPAISFSVGGYYRTAHSGKLGFLSFLDYSRLSNKNEDIPILSAGGAQLNTMEAHINNHYVSLSGLGVMYFGELYVGAGLSGGVLLFSNTKMGKFDVVHSNPWIEEMKENLSKARFTNKHYAPTVLSIPFVMGYNLNRFDILARVNIGLTNRLKGETFVKEFDNTVQIGVGYSLSGI